MGWTTPATWANGPGGITAALLNTQVRDNLLAVDTDDGWTLCPALLSGWTIYGGHADGRPSVKMQGGRVFCRGWIAGGTFTVGTPLVTLPPGFYNPALPKVLRVQPCWASFVRVDVDHANGRLVLLEGHASASNGWLALHMSWDLMA
jgi:hypothetical protein